MIDLRYSVSPADSILDDLAGFGPDTKTGQPQHEVDERRYSAWAGRLHDKSVRDHATILGEPVDPNPPTGYWSSESVLSGDDLISDAGIVPEQMRRNRLLFELGLTPGASAAEVSRAYRALAKVHHPDRWVEADEATRAHHAEKILHVNAVYQALRRSLVT